MDWVKTHKILSLTGLIIVFIIIGVTAGGSPKGSQSNRSNQNSAPTQSYQTTLAKPTETQQVADWNNKYGSSLSSISDDLTKVSADSGNQDVSALNVDGSQLQNDVTTAQVYPAIPNLAAEQHWSSALSHLSSGAQSCVNGTASYDANEITQAASEFSQATDEINATTSAILQISQ